MFSTLITFFIALGTILITHFLIEHRNSKSNKRDALTNLLKCSAHNLHKLKDLDVLDKRMELKPNHVDEYMNMLHEFRATYLLAKLYLKGKSLSELVLLFTTYDKYTEGEPTSIETYTELQSKLYLFVQKEIKAIPFTHYLRLK